MLRVIDPCFTFVHLNTRLLFKIETRSKFLCYVIFNVLLNYKNKLVTINIREDFLQQNYT